MRSHFASPSAPPEPHARRAAGLALRDEVDEVGWLTTFSDLVLQLFGFVILATTLGTAAAPAPAPDAPREQVERSVAATQAEREVTSLQTAAEESLRREGVTVDTQGDAVVVRIADAVAFAPGSARLVPQAMPLIDEVRRLALALPDVAIEVTGHTDDRPIHSPDYPSNLELSLARAAAVARALAEVPALVGRVTARGMGEHQPIASNADALGRARNRRVELRLVRRSQPR